jgi:RNA polymerase sigma factor (sigma-70 family)
VFEEEYAGFGFELMMALLRTGYIFDRCREEGLHLLRMPIAADDREDLAQEVVHGALRSFKTKGLEQGGWQPERGASLRTYFTGALLLQFANVWRKRLRGRPGVPELSLHDISLDLPSPVPGPADMAAEHDAIRRGLAGIEPKTRAALVLTEDGYEQEEIAEILGITRRSVEGLLRRHRSRLAARNQNGESHL